MDCKRGDGGSRDGWHEGGETEDEGGTVCVRSGVRIWVDCVGTRNVW